MPHSDSALAATATSANVRGATARAGDSLLFAAAAHLKGALGTDWRSDVEVHSLGDETAVFFVWLLEHGADNASPRSTQLSLEPGRSLRLNDVLAAQFAFDGKAALGVTVTGGRLLATSRTYNLLAAGNPLGLPDGATFGQYVPALTAAEAIRFGEQGRLIQLSHGSSTVGGFRTNLGLVNATSSAITIQIDLHAASGTLLGTVPVNLSALGYRQLDRVFALVTGGEVEDGYAVVRTTTEQGAFFAYASVVDNLTGDPIAIAAVKLPLREPMTVGEPIFVVAGAHSTGVGGTNWRTDIELHCWGDESAAFTVELLEHGADNSAPSHSRSYILQQGRSLRLNDVLYNEFGFSGQAALRITPTSGHVLVASRTYNLLAAGNSAGLPAGSTFGQFIPGVTAEQAIQDGEEGRLIQLSHTPGGAGGSRTNLVLVNATAKQIDVEVGLYDSGGVVLGTALRSLAPYEYRQLNGVFELVTTNPVLDGYAVVRTTTAGGAVFALASVVDNRTGDPTGLGAAVVVPVDAEAVLDVIEDVFDVLGATTIRDGVEFIQGLGRDGILDVLSAAEGEATRTATGMVIDWGDGTTAPDGSVRSGSVTVDASGLSVTSSAITGTVYVTCDNVRIDGELPAIGSTAWTVDLETRTDGTVAGDVTATPLGSPTAVGSASGTVTVDTAICESYPISGSLTVVHAGGVVIIAPGPACDGSLQREVALPPQASDFHHTFADPSSSAGMQYVHSTSNAVVATYDSIRRAWMPESGGETSDASAPGVIVFHFPLGRPALGGRLALPLAARDWGENGRGRAYLDGSTDGVTWQQLSAVEPTNGEVFLSGGWSGVLPAMFVGATDIWLRTRLYAAGPWTSYGPPYTRLATMCDFDPRGGFPVFELDVDL